MDDRMPVNTSMDYSEKTTETADDVIQALLAALSGKSTVEQNHVLEEFAKCAQGGGDFMQRSLRGLRSGGGTRESIV